MTLKVVYATNVVVSAVLKVGSIPASLLALAMGRCVRLFRSPPILAEYSEVLKRPKYGVDPNAVDALLRDLRRTATMVRPRRRVTTARDEPDNRFLECARAARADYLVTGNRRHSPFPDFECTKIVSPAEFARIVAEQSPSQ